MLQATQTLIDKRAELAGEIQKAEKRLLALREDLCLPRDNQDENARQSG